MEPRRTSSTHPGTAPERAAILRRETKVLIFDLYGTIVDMQAGLTEAATPYLKEKAGTGHRTVSSPGGGEPTSRTR